MKTYEYKNITYKTPKVTLISNSPISNAEIGMRVCYNSFNKSDNEEVKSFLSNPGELDVGPNDTVNNIVNVHMHGSILEHCTFTMFIQGTNRAVLQEYARHRIGSSLSVKSTRHTSSDVINCYYAAKYNVSRTKEEFMKLYKELDILNITDEWLVDLKISAIYDNMWAAEKNGVFEIGDVLSKSAVTVFSNKNSYYSIRKLYEDLSACAIKRHAGDFLKPIIVDEMNDVDMVVTLNLRSVAELFKLRLPDSAWGPIQQLALEMYHALPEDYRTYLGKVNKLVEKK